MLQHGWTHTQCSWLDSDGVSSTQPNQMAENRCSQAAVLGCLYLMCLYLSASPVCLKYGATFALLVFIWIAAIRLLMLIFSLQGKASSLAQVQRPLDVKDWSCDDVAAWMSSQGWVWRELDQYKERACEIGVTGRTLYDLEGAQKLLPNAAALLVLSSGMLRKDGYTLFTKDGRHIFILLMIRIGLSCCRGCIGPRFQDAVPSSPKGLSGCCFKAPGWALPASGYRPPCVFNFTADKNCVACPAHVLHMGGAGNSGVVLTLFSSSGYRAIC